MYSELLGLWKIDVPHDINATQHTITGIEECSSIFQSPNNSLYMGSAPREALGFAGSLGSLARYAGMALGITAGSHILYGQMSVAMGEAVTSIVAGRPDVFLFGFRSVFYVLMAVAAVGFALAMVRLVKMRARH